MRVISVLGRKGGVGKTTIAVGLAGALSRRVPTVLLDCDPQQSASLWLGSGGSEDVPLIAAPTLGAIARELPREGDGVVVCDAPPFDADLNAALFQAADLVVVPVGASLLDVHAAEVLIEAIAESGRKGLVVLNMVDTRTSIRREARQALDGYGVPLARTELVRRVDHAGAVVAQKPVSLFKPGSMAAIEINLLADEVADLVEL